MKQRRHTLAADEAILDTIGYGLVVAVIATLGVFAGGSILANVRMLWQQAAAVLVGGLGAGR